MAGPVFSYLWKTYPAFLGGVHNIYGHLYPRLERPYGDSHISDHVSDPFRPQDPYQQFKTQSSNFGTPSLAHCVTGPPSYDRFGQHYSSVLYQQTARDLFPHPVTSSSGSVHIAANSRYSHQGQTFHAV